MKGGGQEMTRSGDKAGDTPTWHNSPPVAGVIQPVRPELFQPQVKVLQERERKGMRPSQCVIPPPQMSLVPRLAVSPSHLSSTGDVHSLSDVPLGDGAGVLARVGLQEPGGTLKGGV